MPDCQDAEDHANGQCGDAKVLQVPLLSTLRRLRFGDGD